jgi:predicted Fe-Mo cluster-binding NifX family protein
MIIAVSSTGMDLDSQIDPRFGRCAYFIVCDTDDMHFEAFNNESISLGGGAGIQSAQFVISKGVEAVITGNCGPNAAQVLTAANVQLFVGQAGTVRSGIERFRNNELRPTREANVSDHYGMNRGNPSSQPRFGSMEMGPVAPRGTGRGMGGGMGRGMGGGRGAGILNKRPKIFFQRTMNWIF